MRRRRLASFRARILLGMLVLNFVVLGVTLVAVGEADQRDRARVQAEVMNKVVERFAEAFARKLERGEVTVKRLLEVPGWDFLDDCLILHPVLRGDGDRHMDEVAINPLGALGRDNERVRTTEVVRTLRTAIAERRPLAVAGGLCVPFLGRGDEPVVGGGWFLLSRGGDPERFPIGTVVTTLLLSSVAFSLLAYLSFSRRVLKPVEDLSRAAQEFASGNLAARVGARWEGTELDELIRVFDGLAARVQGSQAELRDAVARAIAEARQSERALIQSGRLASMGTLAAGIAHEINNPIGGMLNAVRRLRQDSTTELQVRYLDLVLDGLDRVHRTVRKVLDFAPRTQEPVPFAVAEAVASARALVEHRIKRENVTLTVRAQPGLPRVEGDPHELQQVFLNLFINSLDAIQERAATRPGPGHVTVDLRLVRDAEQRSWVEAVVEDDGCGLEEKDVAHVFDPFFTKKKSGTGTGLGMTICFAILRNHGGSIDVTGRAGQGFRVVLRLPPLGGSVAGEPGAPRSVPS